MYVCILLLIGEHTDITAPPDAATSDHPAAAPLAPPASRLRLSLDGLQGD